MRTYWCRHPLLPSFCTFIAVTCTFKGVISGFKTRCGDPEQTWGHLSHSMFERTWILAKSRKPLAKEIGQLTVEDSAANLKQLVSPLRGPAHGLLLVHSLINWVSHSGLRGCAGDVEAVAIGVSVVGQTLPVVL